MRLFPTMGPELRYRDMYIYIYRYKDMFIYILYMYRLRSFINLDVYIIYIS